MSTVRCANRKTAVIFLSVSACLFLLSVIVIAIFPSVFQYELDKQLPILKDGPLYPLWRDLPIPITERLYFFNITNREKFLKKEEKLKVVEVGPYTYHAKWKKYNIRWYPNSTVSYEELRTYEFDRNNSVGSQDDEIYTFNGPMAMAGYFAKDMNPVFKFGLGIFLAGNGEKLIIKKRIRDLAYDGYEDPIIKNGHWIIHDLPYKNGIFSWLYGKNNTNDGTFTVFTGKNDLQNLNVINNWNGKEKLNFWQNSTCNSMNRSSGEFSPPLKKEQTEYSLFQSILCRSLTLTYDQETEHKNIKTRRFIATEKTLGNASVNPDNACFDTRPHLLSGVQDMGPCQFGAPVLLSFPHFYLADPAYASMTDGIQPKTQQHNSYLDIEPTTGISLDITIRFQINLELQAVPGIGQFEDIPEGVFPLFWAEIKASVNDDMANFFKKKIWFPKQLTYSLVGINMLISVVLFIVGLAVLYRSRKYACDEDDPILQGDKSVMYSGRNNPNHEQQQKTRPLKTGTKVYNINDDDDTLLDSHGNNLA